MILDSHSEVEKDLKTVHEQCYHHSIQENSLKNSAAVFPFFITRRELRIHLLVNKFIPIGSYRTFSQ